MRPALSIPIAAILALGFLAGIYEAEASPFEGLEIKDIELRAEANVPQSEFLYLIKIKRGQRFERKAIERSVRNLFMKGFFRDIVVEAEPWEGGVVLRYITRNILIVDDYKIRGNLALNDKRIRSASGMKKRGEPFSSERNRELARKIADFYGQEGFFDTGVEVKVGKPGEKGKVEVTFEVKEGRLYRIERVLLKAPTGFSPLQLRSCPGEIYRPRVLKKDVETIKKWLKKEGYLAASVSAPMIDLDEWARAATVKINIDAGPKLSLIFKGNDSIGTAKLAELIPIEEGMEPGEEVFERGKKAIESFYKQKGFHFAAVSLKKEAAKGAKDQQVVYLIHEGPRVSVESIDIVGNKALSSREIVKAMELRERRFLSSGRFSVETLEKDLLSIVALYKNRGYLDAKASLKGLEFSADKSLAYITIEVEEGRQTKVKIIRFSGNREAASEQLKGALSLKEGGPYSQQLAERGISEILLHYSARGYLDARVDKEIELSPDKNWAEIKYSVAENGKTAFGDFFIKGNFKTKRKVIERQIGFEQGEPFDPQKIVQARRSLDALGIFRSLRFEPLEGERGRDDKVRDILLEVAEKDSKQINFGVGFDSEELFRGFAEYVDINLMGMDRVFRLRGEASFLRQIFSTSLEEPRFLGSKFRSDFALSAREVEDIETFNSRTIEGLAHFERDFGARYTGSLTYKFQDIELSDVRIKGPIPEEELSGRFASQALRLIPALTAKELQSFTLSSFTPSLRRDTRDDKLDPRKGSFNSVSLELADDLLGSEAEFYKLTGESKWYAAVSGNATLALSAKAGLVRSFGKMREVPLPIRFFTGGSNTVRGFELNSLGPKGIDAFPIGGEFLAVLNAELRWPLSEKLQGVLFNDNGNVFARVEDFDFPALRSSAGLGVRYLTPIGPVRLDWGHVLDHEPGEKRWRFHFSFGHAF